MRAPSRPVAVSLAVVLGVAALVSATWTTVIRITVGTTSRLANLDTELSGWDRHGPALLVVGAFALVMLVGAARGARPAMVAVLVCGVAALVVALGLVARRSGLRGAAPRERTAHRGEAVPAPAAPLRDAPDV